MRDQISTSTSNTISSTFKAISDSAEFQDFIEMSMFQKMNNGLFALLAYVDSFSSYFIGIQSIISYVRLFQFLGPSFAAPFINIWENGQFSSKLIGFISVFFHLFTPSSRLGIARIALLLYFAFFIVFFILLLLSSRRYRLTARIPSSICILIALFMNTFGYISHPIALELLSEVFGKILNPSTGERIGAEVIQELLIIFFTFFAYQYLMTRFTSLSVAFRPDSLITLHPSAHMKLFAITQGITILLGIASQLSRVYQMGIIIFCLFGYLFSTNIVFSGGGLINPTHIQLFLACSFSGMINLVVVLVHIYFSRKGSDLTFFLFIASFLVSLMLSIYLTKRKSLKQLEILDAIESNPDAFEKINSPKELLNISITGFSYAHSTCISWQLFKLATAKWGDSLDVWMIYGKYIAIYPEESRQLEWILKNISTHERGNDTTQIIVQIKSILRRRESNLSNELKNRLNQTMKYVESAKQKMRNIWDLILQGNINEMESNIDRAYIAVDRAQLELNRLLQQYPNNRFVGRRYARFALEIKADHARFSEWSEKVRLLQRGIRISQDSTYELGLKAFPLLPQFINVEKNIQMDSESMLDCETEMDEESLQVSSTEQSLIFRKQIQNLTPPSVTCFCMNTVFIVLLFIIIPSTALLIYALTSISDVTQPLSPIYSLALMRNLNFQLQAFGIRYIGENLYSKTNSSDIIFPKPQYDSSNKFTNLGFSNRTIDHLNSLLGVVEDSVNGISSLRSYMTGEDKVDQVRKIIFQNTIPGRQYYNSSHYIEVNSSAQSIFLSSVMSISRLTQEVVISESVLSSSIMLNPSKNMNNLGDSISEALSLLIDYLKDTVEFNLKWLDIGIYAVASFFIIGAIPINIAELYLLYRDKKEVYKCLAAIPKNVASSVADSLRNLSRRGNEGTTSTKTDSDLNKQEENILKIFASASDTKYHVGERVKFIIISIFIIFFGILSIEFIINFLQSELELVSQYAPHIDNILGAVAYMNGGVSGVMSIALSINGYDQIESDPMGHISEVSVYLKNMSDYYANARFGTQGNTDNPYESFEENIISSSKTNNCESPLSIVTTNQGAYSCMNTEQQFHMFENLIWSIVYPYQENYSTILTNNSILTELWALGPVLSFNNFFSPIYTDIIPTLTEKISSSKSSITIPVTIFLTCVILSALWMIIEIQASGKKIRFSLELILHCPTGVILQTPKIMSVLSGNFSQSNMDTTNRDEEFFDSVVKNLPDSVFCINLDGSITSVNNSVERAFKTNKNDIIHTEASVFFGGNNFESDIPLVFGNNAKGRSQIETCHAIFKNPTDQSTTNYLISLIRTPTYTIVTCRDESQIIKHNKLIKEERAKSDQLLSAILPARIVSKVQQGEKNITFSVECATIIFIDIVEFTPWCASNTANKVMSVLNTIFREYDSLLVTFSTLTKIKCIGDCYMAAGGIFTEINQPVQHAKESVEFALGAISIIQKVNEMMGEKLRIRIGVNTGGPIIAGVLGTDKPMFEILGPAINMAQQLEHHGLPMQIHISRSLYELIYGSSFKVKERGQIEFKQGQVFTYIVEPK